MAGSMSLEGLISGLVGAYGLVGIFLASIIGNATILFPLPIDLLVFGVCAVSGSWVNALGIGIITGIGAAIGEMTSYIFGLLGISAAELARRREFGRLEDIRNRIRRSGMVFIALAAFTPFPFDLVGIAAGLVKYPPKRFFIAALAGKLPRYILIALAGFYGWGFVSSLLFIN